MLPGVHYAPVHLLQLTIDGVVYKAIRGRSGSFYCILATSPIATQAGCIKVGARAELQGDNNVNFSEMKAGNSLEVNRCPTASFVRPFEYVAIKREEKFRISMQQQRLLETGGCDSSLTSARMLGRLCASPTAAPFVPKFVDALQDDDALYLITEYFDGGDLRTFMSAQPTGVLDEDNAKVVVEGALRALDAMHRIGWCHRDVSPQNILIATDATRGGRVLRSALTDFGTAAAMEPDPALMCNPWCVCPTCHFGDVPHGGAACALCVATPYLGESPGVAPCTGVVLENASRLVSTQSRAVPQRPSVVADVGAPVPLRQLASDTRTARPTVTLNEHPCDATRTDSWWTRLRRGATPSSTVLSACASTPNPIETPDDVNGITHVATQVDPVCFVRELEPRPGESLGGWVPLPPPELAAIFCKPSYADPLYVWRRRHFGVSFDLYSVGVTLWCMLVGSELYEHALPGFDAGFDVLWQNERLEALVDRRRRLGVSAGFETTVRDSHCFASPNSFHFRTFIATVTNTARAAENLPPLSGAVVDLLVQLLRLRPRARPLTARDVLTHTWFAK